jgi:hypothetical protein
MIEIILNGMDYVLEILLKYTPYSNELVLALSPLVGYILWSLYRARATNPDSDDHNFWFLVFLFLIITIVLLSFETKEEIFLNGITFIFIFYSVFFLISLAKMKPIFKELSRINIDVMLLLGLLFTYRYTNPSLIENYAFYIVIFYILITEIMVFAGKNHETEAYDSATHTLKKGYLLNIEEIDKEISLMIIVFATIALSSFNWLSLDVDIKNNGTLLEFESRNIDLKNTTVLDKTHNVKNLEVSFEGGNKVNHQGLKKPAYQELFNYQMSIFILALLMLIFSSVKFFLKHDELTKKETKTVALTSRGRYGEYYGCSNTLIWVSRRRSIRKSLKNEFYPKDDTFKDEFFTASIFDLGSVKDPVYKLKWDYFCQLASAYYSHAISIDNIKDKDQYIQYLLKAFYIYENLKEPKPDSSDEHYHHIDLRNDIYLLFNDPDTEARISELLKKDPDKKVLAVLKGFYEVKKDDKEYENKLKQSTNYQYNKILESLQAITIDTDKSDIAEKFDDAMLKLDNIGKKAVDEKQRIAASKHIKIIELLNALKNAHDRKKIIAWVKELKFAKGHISKNIEKFKAKRFDAPANLFITTTGVIISIIAIISILEIFDYSKVIDIEIFALSGGVLSMVFAFIFKSVIESFFASLQMYLSDMLRVGDRIKCEALSIDGYVSGFGFSSIDFQNLDNSHIKVPAKDLIEKTFSNLRTLPETGRRIEIKLTFSTNSIKIFTSSDVKETQEEVVDMKAYLDCKLKSMSKFNCDKVATVEITHSVTALNVGETATVTFTFSEEVSDFASADVTVANGSIGTIKTSDNIVHTATYTPTDNVTDTSNVIITVANCIEFQCYKNKIDEKKDFPQRRFLSNLGSFRAYAEQYLFEHQWLNDSPSPMVVIYDTSAEGVSVLFTAYSQPDPRFVRTKAFMSLESDIVEHLITTSQYFKLKLHQSESESKDI